MYVFVLCALVVLFFGTGHLNGSWFLTAQGCMLDWLGDVTSTVSFCQLSEGVCYLMNLCINFHASYRPTMCVKYSFGIVFEWYFCPGILSMFNLLFLYIVYKFHPLWDQYTDSIVPLAYVPVWCCACYFVKSDLSVNNLSHFVSTWSNQCCQSKPIGGIYLL